MRDGRRRLVEAKTDKGFDLRCGAGRVAALACHWHAIHYRSRSNPTEVSKKTLAYDSALYDDLLRGWYRETISALAQTSDKRTEVLWMNFEPEGQPSLFEGDAGA